MSLRDYSINYFSSAGNDGNDIVIPGESPQQHSSRKKDNCDGVVITPDTTGIVIKTRLLKEKQGHISFDNDSSVDSYVPPSLSSIYAGSQSNVGDEDAARDDTKLFLNVVSHPLIAVPGQRKGLDEETGKEIDGWRLPMSMGEIRPTYDKQGSAAIVADCILNPKVIREMNADSNHFHFVCDLVVQCASRKFGRTHFGGLELDRRFKLPKMKYAGYVDETTGMPLLPEPSESVVGAVAKQRVKGHGGKKSIIQEVSKEPSPAELTVVSDANTRSNLIKEIPSLQPGASEEEDAVSGYVELFVCNGDQDQMPLFEFLRLSADKDGILPRGQPSSSLRELIKNPKLKPCNENENLHKSQRLCAPMPFDMTTLVHKEKEYEAGSRNSIVAKCSIVSTVLASKPTIPTVELSAFQLVLSTGNNSQTECILPFPVDSQHSTTTYDESTGMLEVHMPLLPLCVDKHPDPGTRQYGIQKALGKNGRFTASVNTGNKDEPSRLPPDDSFKGVFGSYFVEASVDENEVEDDTKPLPEDTFHSQDVLSQHLMQTQDEERKERSAKSAQDREGADVEYINVNDFKPNGREDKKSQTLAKAESAMKKIMLGSKMGGDLVLGLV